MARFSHACLPRRRRAATQPLQVALDRLEGVLEPGDFASGERLHLEATAGVLTVSVRKFGPRYLPQGLAKLRELLTDALGDGVVGRILTDFLQENVESDFEGSLADWETAFEALTSSLADLPDCRIPCEMLRVAVRYSKTGDERHMWNLPLEQRQLLEDILPSATDEQRRPSVSYHSLINANVPFASQCQGAGRPPPSPSRWPAAPPRRRHRRDAPGGSR